MTYKEMNGWFFYDDGHRRKIERRTAFEKFILGESTNNFCKRSEDDAVLDHIRFSA